MEKLEGFEIAPYFEHRVVKDPARSRRVLPHVADAINNPEEMMPQPDGKVRRWRYVPELGHHIRLVTTVDGALFNVALRFEYYPETDSLYIELNPGRKSAPGGWQEVVGWGSHDIVIDVDGDGTPVGIDIDSFASEVVDLSKLEVEGPIFGLARSESAERQAG